MHTGISNVADLEDIPVIIKTGHPGTKRDFIPSDVSGNVESIIKVNVEIPEVIRKGISGEGPLPGWDLLDLRHRPEPSRAYIGIDNGPSGGLAGIFSTGQVWVTPTKILKLGAKGGRILDIQGNLDWILRFSAVALDSYGDTTFIAYEQGQKQPKFGCKGNYSTGASNEFWRVLLTLAKFAHSPVNPQTWQALILKDIRGDDTKIQVAQVVAQRFPKLDLSEYNKEQRGGIVDALCIATWAKETNK